MGKVLSTFVCVYVLAWLAFAFWDIGGGSDTIKVYEVRPTAANDPSLPEMVTNSVIEYRVGKTNVTSNNNGFVSKYEDCHSRCIAHKFAILDIWPN